MATFLFEEIIFGPVFSRRLGVSLGINLLPTEAKYCNFNCLYCECGWTNLKDNKDKLKLPTFEEFYKALENRLLEMKSKNKPLGTITFAGNGEPTIHPDFEQIIDATIELRNKYYPETLISVLTNATMIGKEHIFKSLLKIEQPILKLDSGILETVKLLNSPPQNYTIENQTNNFLKFNGNFILQTLFLKGKHLNQTFDNTSETELKAWLEVIKITKPKLVMIYTIARDTPASGLEKIEIEKLNEIAEMVNNLGFETQVSA